MGLFLGKRTDPNPPLAPPGRGIVSNFVPRTSYFKPCALFPPKKFLNSFNT